MPQERLRGRLLGLLGWLVGVHLGRPAEGLEHASVALALGREHDDDVLVAQAASVVSTTSLLLGTPVEGLVDEAVTRGAAVVGVDLVLWPRALRGRQRLWDGRLTGAREDLAAMHAAAERGGTEYQLAYRCCDLALLEVATGDLDAAASSSRRRSRRPATAVTRGRCPGRPTRGGRWRPCGATPRPRCGAPTGSTGGPTAPANGLEGDGGATSGGCWRCRPRTGPPPSSSCSPAWRCSTTSATCTPAPSPCCRRPCRSRCWPGSPTWPATSATGSAGSRPRARRG